jgi:hypothetical protein
MIPPNSELRNRLSRPQIARILINPNNYFELADEYIGLQNIFLKESWIGSISLWVDMIIYPIFSFVTMVMYSQTPTIFTMLSLHKTITLWSQWIRYKTLTYEIREWMNTVRSIGGPFISSNDPTYHMFVYADGMQRVWDSLFVLPKKGAKRAK